MTTDAPLADKVSVVTGAGGTIGGAIAEELATVGSDIVLAVHNDEEVSGEIEAMGRRAHTVQCDVSDADDVRSVVDETIEEFGRIDIVVNSAAALTVGKMADLEESDWDTVMGVNAKGTFLVSKYTVPHLKKTEGTIVNVSSISGEIAAPDHSHYGASKHAQLGLTRSAAMELADDNVTVNALCPGIVESQLWTDIMAPHKTESYGETVERVIPLGCDQTPAEMGEAAVFLATNENITGQALTIDGGIIQDVV